MKNKNKLARWNASRRELALDLESIVRNARLEYRNHGIPAFSEESHIVHKKIDYAFDIIAELSRTVAEQQSQINELTAQLLRRVRDDHHEDTEDTIEITMRVSTKVSSRRKWTPEAIEREFDHYRRDNAYFGLITPEIVKNNWSTLFTQCPRYTGMTLGQFLNRYNSSRSML